MKNISDWILTIVMSTTFLICINLRATTRIAIISKNTANFADMLSIKLSSIKNIELLDRTEIRKILKEHEISAMSITSRKALVLNKLIPTDIFVIIKSDFEKEKPQELIIFDANTGIRYIDTPFPDKNIEQLIMFAEEKIQKALIKRKNASKGKLKYVSLLSLRNIDLPIGGTSFCNAVQMLLMQQLGNSSNIAVLERSYLDYIIKERTLLFRKLKNHLKTSSLILDLEFSMDLSGNNKKIPKPVNCTVYVNNKKIALIKGNYYKPEKLAANIAKKCAEYFNTPLKHNNINIYKTYESKRLYNEYLFVKESSIQEAYIKISAWHALNPDTPSTDYVFTLIDYAVELARDNKIDKALDHFEQALNLAKKWTIEKYPNNFHLYNLNSYLNKYFLKNNVSEKQKTRAGNLMLRSIEFEKYILELEYGISFNPDPVPLDFKTFDQYCKMIRIFLLDKPIDFAPSWQDLFNVYKKSLQVASIYARKSKDTNQHHFSHTGIYTFLLLFFEIQNHNHEFSNETQKKEQYFSKKQKQQITELFTSMLKHPFPTIRVIGKCGLIYIDICSKKTNSEYLLKKRKEIADFVKIQLKKLGNDKRFQVEKETVYFIACNTIEENTLCKKASKNTAVLLFDFMCKRKELSLSIIRGMKNYICYPKLKPELWSKEKMHKFGLKIKELYDNPNTFILRNGESKDETKRQIKEIIDLTLKDETKKDISSDDIPVWKKQLSFENIQGSPVIAPPFIYLVVKKDNAASLIRVNPEKNEIEYITGQTLKFSSSKFLNRNQPSSDSSSIAGNYFLLNGEYGLGIFSLDNSFKPFIIDNSTGLASSYIRDAACIGDQILITAGTLYFYLFDLKKRKLKLLCSTKDKEKRSPFSNCSERLSTRGMITDPKRNRVIFCLNGIQNCSRLQGLWQFNLKTQKFKRIVKFSDQLAITKRNNNILISLFYFCYYFDIKNDTIHLIYAAPQFCNNMTINNIIFPGMKKCNITLTPQFMLSKSYFWSSRRSLGGFKIIDIKTGDIIQLPKLINFGTPSYINLMNNGKFLLVGQQGGMKLFIYKNENPKRNGIIPFVMHKNKKNSKN